MRRLSWLTTGVSLVLSLVLLSCGYVKKDEFEEQLSVQRMDLDEKVQVAQSAAVEATDKADKNLETARKEIAKAKEEAISAAMAKDAETLAAARASIEAGDNAVKSAAEKAAQKALADSNAFARTEDEKVKQAAKMAADKALSAAEEADRKATQAAREAELAKELPRPKDDIKYVVYFDLGQAKWKKEGDAELAKAAEMIRSYAKAEVRIEGHTDDTPIVRTRRYKSNWELSQARAEAVKDHLFKLGVPAETIKQTKGLAFYSPTGASKPLNRRTEVIVTIDSQVSNQELARTSMPGLYPMAAGLEEGKR
jgi:chemotaxis protein MotB